MGTSCAFMRVAAFAGSQTGYFCHPTQIFELRLIPIRQRAGSLEEIHCIRLRWRKGPGKTLG